MLDAANVGEWLENCPISACDSSSPPAGLSWSCVLHGSCREATAESLGTRGYFRTKIDIEQSSSPDARGWKPFRRSWEIENKDSRKFPTPSTASVSRINMEAGCMLRLGGGTGGAANGREADRNQKSGSGTWFSDGQHVTSLKLAEAGRKAKPVSRRLAAPAFMPERVPWST